jgi:predicted ATPase/signal transduction histidine kinase/DNA-binding NarL/FixJ family response regulator
LIQALQAVIRGIMTGSESGILDWKERMIACLQENARIITEIIPEVEKIIGPQAPAPRLEPLEAQFRFCTVMLSFIRLFADNGKPFVLFLDDLQWADPDSLRLLERMAGDLDSRNILLIGAYRNNEAGAGHPLQGALDKMQQAGCGVSVINLGPLSQEHVGMIVAAALRSRASAGCPPGARPDSDQLAAACMAKTQGNPFFLTQFLYSMKDDGLIWFDAKQKRWAWDYGSVLRTEVTDNVVDLMIRKIDRLPSGTVEVLQLAACINNAFDARTLAIVAEKPPEAIEEALARAVTEGLIMFSEGTYQFLHDRIQQAAYSLAPDSARVQMHYRIGVLLYNTSDEEVEERLFEIADHLNSASGLISDREERRALAGLNLKAGKKARSAAAYEKAYEYLALALDLLDEDCWASQYDLMLDLHLEAAEAAYACTHFEAMERIAATTLAHARDLLDRARIYEVRIAAYTLQNDLERSLATSWEILRLLGIKMPANPGKWHLLWGYLRTRLALAGRPPDRLLDLPTMKDRHNLTALRIMNYTSIASAQASHNHCILLAFNVLIHTLKHGIAEEAICSYAGYGSMIYAMFNQAEEGYEYGKLALRLSDQFGGSKYECFASFVFNIIIRQAREPLRNTLLDFPGSYQKGFAAGDLLNAGGSIMQYFLYSYFSGRELPVIEQELQQHWPALLKSGHQMSIHMCEMLRQSILNFKGDTGDPCRLAGLYFNEDTVLPESIKSNDGIVVFSIYFHRLLQFFYFGRTEAALEDLPHLEAYLDGVLGTYCIPLVQFYKSLVLFASAEQTNGLKKFSYLAGANRCIRAMQRYARTAPANNLHKLYLMQAERERLRGRFLSAANCYDRAIELAGRNEFLQEEALANELAARSSISAGRVEAAAKYLTAAYLCYKRWGGHAKAQDLIRKYPAILASHALPAPEEQHDHDSSSLDLLSIIKASQAISGALVLDELLQLLIRIIIQNAGAQKAVFIMKNQGRLFIEAEGNAADNTISVLQSIPLDEPNTLPVRLINYVARTGESVVLKTGNRALFGLDEHDRPRSAICLPVTARRSMQGILYLENNLLPGAFSSDSVTVIHLLSSQVAISLENAKLYRDMEGIIQERTDQLNQKNSELIRINDQLEAASQAKSQFVANISHELRTPLHGIQGMASLLQKSGLDGNEREYTNMIHSSAQGLLQIINDILDISKVEANRLDLVEQAFSLRSLLKEIFQSFQLEASNKGLALTCEIDPRLPQFLVGDANRIRQVLVNIVNNAIKFTEAGRVSLNAVLQSVDAACATVEVAVRDNGIGIPEPKQGLIWDCFTQADASIAKQFGGTGLGLAISKNLIELMGGRIELESAEGEGSLFRCIFPLRLGVSDSESWSARPAGAAETSLPDARQWPRLRIIVAEDNEIGQKYIKSLLEYHKCEATVAANGLELMDLLETGAYDCILMDKNMPGMDGMEATRLIRLREQTTGRHIPIVALTASALTGDRENLLESGLDYYLSKPIRESDLAGILDQIGRQGLIDRPVLIEEWRLFGGDLMREIVEKYLQSYQAQVDQITEHASGEQFQELESAAHRFASSVSCFYAGPVLKAAGDLEKMAHAQQTEGLDAALAHLKQLAGRLSTELEQILPGVQAP